MPHTTLTDVTLKSLDVPLTGQITYWDKKLPGFGCRVSQGGQKTFVVMFGPRSARRRKVVGKYPLQNLKTARDRARKALAGVTLGIVEEPSSPVSFKEARDQFITMVEGKNKPTTAYEYKRLLKKHFPFGSRQLASVERIDIQRCLNKLATTPTEHKHAFAVIRTFFNWAYKEELIEKNPADRVQKPKPSPARERVLSEEELRVVLRKAFSHPWPYGAIVALCLLTGQRRCEIAMLRVEWINQAERTITWPGELVKNGRTTTIPYGELTASLLAGLPSSNGYLFPGRNRTNPIFNGWSKCKVRFDRELVGVAPYKLHDLRRTFSTTHAKRGTAIHVTERLLNHTSGAISGVAAIYNRHSYMPEIRQACEGYERYLAELIA